jgi:hypothetical protein
VKRLTISNFLLLGMTVGVLAQNSAPSQPAHRVSPRERLQQLMFTPPAYRREALQLVIREANQVARELKLPEQLPITESNIVNSYIAPPQMAKRATGFGNITTSNYVYFVTVGNKFSFLERIDLQEAQDRFEKQYLWPIERLDTNAAYQVATQLLSDASMDVKALSRDCQVHIDPVFPDDQNRKIFVPLYWVYWMRPGTVGSIAEVELFLPTKALQQMHVMKPEYILRKPIEITNVDFLLTQTNAPEAK